jgi:class 3 adenylate cyclase
VPKVWLHTARTDTFAAVPTTRYARAGNLHIAYQVVGDRPLDLVFLPDWVNHLEVQWEEPRHERFLKTLASFSRLILFNPRGVGASDPVPVSETPTAEQWMDDLGTVIDAVPSEQPALFGVGVGGVIAILFAATFPERVRALVLYNSTARGLVAPDYPFGMTRESLERTLGNVEERWGDGSYVEFLAPEDADDERLRQFHARFQRLAASPGLAVTVQEIMYRMDVRHALSAIQVPTLVVHRAGAPIFTVEHGRYLAEHIDGAVYRELPGAGHIYWASGAAQPLLEAVEEFLTGTVAAGPPDRVLATVLFTDIVDSTATAVRLGDQRWKEQIHRHDAIVGREIARHAGREIRTTGDGVLAIFDGPARAIRCARAIRVAVRELGLEVRAGLHTGEIELHGDDVAGVAVHIGARVSALARAGEILLSRTVVDLVAGSGLTFVERGSHVLKGVPGEWQVFALAE